MRFRHTRSVESTWPDESERGEEILGAYLVRRFGLMMLTLFGISVIIFLLLRMTPGNIADILFDAGGFVDPADKARIERDLGLDKPLPVTFSILFGVPLGVISAVRQNTGLDYALRIISLSGLSMPSFWLGLLILMAFVAYAGTIPIYSDQPSSFWHWLMIYSVPAAAVGFRSSALLMRMTRSSMLEVLRQDYIRTARSKGASERVINYYHALKNAMLPVVTLIGIEAAFLLGGLIVTETVFNIPGVARFLVEAVRWRDYPMVQNLVMFIAIVVVTVNFIVDMMYAALDPRIKYAD
jgi:peptide/nickel transport system permease protein